MRLLIDIGNSRMKWAWQSTRQIGPMDTMVYDVKNLASELPVIWQEHEPPLEVWIASVVASTVTDMINGFLASQWGLVANYIQAGHTALGVRNAYIEPDKLGSDRWAAMLAAYGRENKSVLVVDCGTAVTVDAIDNQGLHLGGTISPGVKLCTSVLDQQTNLQWLTSSEHQLANNVLARSTQEAITTGVGYSIVGLIEHIYHMLGESGHHPVVYLTGGDAAYISQALSMTHKSVDDLVLQGLAMLADHA